MKTYSSIPDAEFKEMVIQKFGLSYWNTLEQCVDNAIDGFEDDFISDYDYSPN